MKSYKTTIFALLIMLLTISCGKDESSSPTSTFSVDPEAIGFKRNAGSKNINITCDGVWTASVSGSWATVDPTMGSGNGTIRVSVSANPDQFKSRSCVVTISNGDVNKEVSVLQKATSK
jgi:hypothetical protein